ncbi:MAG: glycosyltransferase family 4 protein [Rhizobiaceae bacterium]|nr:glycosyltransferase family 4 protein [Rhizobiaceae bacterium]
MKTVKQKILYVCTEDWFFRSHFLSLNKAAIQSGKYQTAIACNTSEARSDLENAGLKVWPANVSRSSIGVFSALRYMWQIAKIYRIEKPDIIHIIGLKPILLGGLVAIFFSKSAKMYHVIGLGTLAEGRSWRAKLVRRVAFALVVFQINRRRCLMGVENPDDLEYLRQYGKISNERVTLFGGAGINTDEFKPLPLPNNSPPVVAFVGRMIWTKGIDVLVKSHQLLRSQGVMIDLDLYGSPDPGNPNTFTGSILEQWSNIDGINWHGESTDIESVWRKSDICVVSTRTREGMPRAMLEAAAYGRALVVSDVPGCRHFVRDGVEGFIVKPDDAKSLAAGIRKLVTSPQLLKKMGKAARARIVEAYSEKHIQTKTLEIYRKLLG